MARSNITCVQGICRPYIDDLVARMKIISKLLILNYLRAGSLEEQTLKALATLTPREEKVLRMRFGIGERSDHTLEEVGQNFDVTR